MTMTAAEQLRVLAKIWGNDREGFVFLPWISGTAKTQEARRKAYHEGPAYQWPTQQDAIKKHLSTHTEDDCYFTPCLFDQDRRIEQHAKPERALWADLDEISPEADIPDQWKPSIAWASSPGRYQGIWLLDKPLLGASWAGKENQRLTVMLGADPSGWDTTQLLRVPGRVNHKPAYADDGKVTGFMLWDDGPTYSLDMLSALPEVSTIPTGEDIDFVDEEALGHIDRHDVWGRVRLKVSSRVREFMAVKGKPGDIERGDVPDRSNIAWEIIRELADAGCSIAEIVVLIRPSVWNTYAGRNDELKRLKIQAAKAVGDRHGATSLESDFEVMERPTPDTLYDLMIGTRERPSWLVQGVWAEGAVGFISGEPKSYKSWFGLDLAISVATGEPFLGDAQFSVAGTGAPVLYLQEEDSEMVVVDRAESVIMGRDHTMHPHGYVTVAAEVDRTGSNGHTPGVGTVWWNPPVHDRLRRLHVYARRGFKLSEPGWQAWLDETLEHTEARLLVIDTLGTTAGMVDIDKAQVLNDQILGPLKVLSSKHGCAVCVIHHNNKGTDKVRAGQKMLGSTALHAWVENALYISEKSRWGAGFEVTVERESKAAADTRFKVRVPMMGVQFTHDGVGHTAEAGMRQDEMLWWSPEIVSITENEESGTQSRIASPEEKKATRKKGGHKPGGSKIANKLKNCGGSNEERARTVDYMVESFGMNASEIRRQLVFAVGNGLIVGNEETGYWTVT